MSKATEKEFKILRNLKDAGCSKETIETFFLLEQEGKTRLQLRLLSQHRNALLREVHENQEKIDCLDYLIHGMKQRSIENKRRRDDHESA